MKPHPTFPPRIVGLGNPWLAGADLTDALASLS